MWKIDLLIFDLDGTLADTREDLASAVNHVRAMFGLTPLSVEIVTAFIGGGQRRLLERSLPREYWGRMEEASRLFRKYYGEHALDSTRLYPGVVETLDHFSRKMKAVISNKPERFSRLILKGLGIESYFNLILGGDSSARMKPHPSPILWVLDRLKVRGDMGVMVGDSPSDIEAGRLAGVKTCAVTYGYREREVLAASKPDLVIDDIRELRSLFF